MEDHLNERLRTHNKCRVTVHTIAFTCLQVSHYATKADLNYDTPQTFIEFIRFIEGASVERSYKNSIV